MGKAATFSYRARDDAGKPVKGAMEAFSKMEVASKLRKMGYIPTYIREIAPGIQLEGFGEGFRRVRVEDIIIFNIQLANMIDSGLSILSSLRAIASQVENRKFKKIIEEVIRSVEAGSSFSDALAHHPRVFSNLFINTVRAGEASGKLNLVLNRLAVYVEQQEELKQKIKGALFYPAILLTAGLAVIVLVVSFVIPQFVEIFTEAGVALPALTMVLYKFGTALKKFWYVFILVLAVCIISVRAYARTGAGRFRLDRLKIRAPVIGPLVRKVVISRFSRTLATLVDSGVPILQSLDIVRDVIGNEILRRVVESVREGVEKGESIAQPLKVSGEFPPDVIQMVAVGEETGKLGPMLNKVADFYDSAVGYAVKKVTTLIEPVFLVVLGCMAGLIMASMLLPMFDMIKVIRH